MSWPAVMASGLNECMYFNSSGCKNVEGGGKKESRYAAVRDILSLLTCQVERRHLGMKREIKVEDVLDVKCGNDLLNFCPF